MDDLYAAIGYGGLSQDKVITRVRTINAEKSKARRIREELDTADGEELIEQEIKKTHSKKRSDGVIIDGMDNCAIRYAQCCNPLPGDEIIGFITRGYGVSVHKKDCKNIEEKRRGDKEENRFAEARWSTPERPKWFKATLDILAGERNALLADISHTVSSNNIPIVDSNSHRLKNGNAAVLMTIEVASSTQLQNILDSIRKIHGVISAERTGKS